MRTGRRTCSPRVHPAAQETRQNQQLPLFWVLSTSVLVPHISQKCSRSCSSLLSADKDATRGGSLSLRLPEKQIALKVSAVNCDSALSSFMLLMKRSHRRITAPRLSTSLDTFFHSQHLQCARCECAACLLPPVPCLPSCCFTPCSFTACSFEEPYVSHVCVTCLDKPSPSQHTLSLSAYLTQTPHSSFKSSLSA